MTQRRKTTQEVLEGLARERARLDAAVRSLGGGASTTHVTAEGWTAKDMLGHLIHWASQIAFGLGAKLEPPSYVVNAENRPTGHDEWNARAAAHYRDWPFEKVKAEFDHVVDALGAPVRKRSDDQMNATDQIPWAGARPLWQQIEGETTEHWLHHADDIARAARGVA
jgi:uncharacterized protein (TIGR03083 family)